MTSSSFLEVSSLVDISVSFLNTWIRSSRDLWDKALQKGLIFECGSAISLTECDSGK